MTPEQFRSFIINELNAILSMPLAKIVQSKTQRALASAFIAYISVAPIEVIAEMQKHYKS